MKLLFQASMVLLLLSIISGVLYPALVTGAGQLLWPHESNGSLVKQGNQIIGSQLIAQPFNNPEYFWPRPSASSFNAMPSAASNLGPTSADLAKSIAQRRSELSSALGVDWEKIPTDLLTTSASGLDPHISLASARIQVDRIARARGLDEVTRKKIDDLIDEQRESRQFWILGEPRVNVLSLNLGLDICCGRGAKL